VVADARVAERLLLVLVMLSLPVGLALTAVGHAPDAHVRIAGQDVSVRPVLGQSSSRLFGGALVQPRHATVPGLGKAVGVDVDADFNRIVPSDKRTRSYLTALWENPRPAIDLIQGAARDYLVMWGGGGLLVGAVVDALLGLVLWRRRQRFTGYTDEQAELVDRHNRVLRRTSAAVAALAVVAVDVVGARVWAHDDHRPVVGNRVFHGTALEGTEVHGLLADVLPFLDVLRPRSQFYERVSHNLETALAARPELTDSADTVTFVLAEDFEDVNGMARQVGHAANLVDADFLALSGDLTFAGKAVETYVLDTIDYYAKDRPVYFAPGLHDTRTIVDAARARGWHVADGTSDDVDGLRLLSLADPRISTIGSFGDGDVQRVPGVDTDAFVTDTVGRACADRPDFILLHDHVLGGKIAQAGCQGAAVLDGRSYQMVGPRPVTTDLQGTTTEYTSGSAGGHVDTRPDPGVIRHPATFSILAFRPDTGETRYSVVTVFPDGAVTVSRPAPLSVPWQPSGD
jgi:hypothetical protein